MTMDPRLGILVTLLQAVRGLLHATDMAIVQVLEFLKEDIHRAAEEDAPSDPPGSCTHPANAREPMPTMGHVTRFRCRNCGEIVG